VPSWVSPHDDSGDWNPLGPITCEPLTEPMFFNLPPLVQRAIRYIWTWGGIPEQP
jgi:hypothetical protein